MVLKINTGSSSMASVCGGSMALMDAGVSICAPVAGIAMGLISVPNLKRPYEIEDYRILTDILGLEDYLGDMDFKIAGSEKSISALQLDVKVPGVPLQVIKDAIEQRNKLEIPIHKLSHFLGIGRSNIKKIRAETGCQLIFIENGIFTMYAPNSEAKIEALEFIEKLLTEEVFIFLFNQ
ncbi:polyribonucleotide nucleotidyltransferase 1, mitochondrial [Caerostris extrusa]|uniref:Polyribonucleotide nucleotidyltransferase 1, mitochondrial n=1 Tax=Caerostris extrusa TaxID=172846 RepID=A0AAV4T197_CAEEX|nr:polyribonucleotide nucleotidyltransferase 1, mitochondrial [Caerostris extrusa]